MLMSISSAPSESSRVTVLLCSFSLDFLWASFSLQQHLLSLVISLQHLFKLSYGMSSRHRSTLNTLSDELPHILPYTDTSAYILNAFFISSFSCFSCFLCSAYSSACSLSSTSAFTSVAFSEPCIFVTNLLFDLCGFILLVFVSGVVSKVLNVFKTLL